MVPSLPTKDQVTAQAEELFGGLLQYATPAPHDVERMQQDRERQQRAEAARAVERRREAEEQARQETEETAFNRHWESLSPAQREAFTADALAHAERYYLGFQSRRYRQQADPTSPTAVASLRTILRAHCQAWHTPAGPTPATE